jgi:hypothetical protein
MGFDTDEGYREPVATVNLRFTFKLLIFLVIIFFGTIFCIYLTYKAYTDPSFFLNDKNFLYSQGVFYLIFFLTVGIPSCIGLVLFFLYYANLKRIEVYKNKVVQRARIGWLPPFNKSFEYKPEQIKVYASVVGKKTYFIVFSKNKGICSSYIFQELYLSFFCKDVIRFSTNKSQISSPYRKDEVLALINFLLENIEDEENIKKLKEFKEEVLKWK